MFKKNYYTGVVYDEFGKLYGYVNVFQESDEINLNVLLNLYHTLNKQGFNVAFGTRSEDGSKNKFNRPPSPYKYMEVDQKTWEKAFETALKKVNPRKSFKGMDDDKEKPIKDVSSFNIELEKIIHKNKPSILPSSLNKKLIQWINDHDYDIYIPLLEKIFEVKHITIDELVVQAIAIKNPNFTYFTPRLIELILERHIGKISSDFGTFYFRHRESLKHKQYICTLIKHGLNHQSFVSDYYHWDHLFKEYFDCWANYLRENSIELIDKEDFHSYFTNIINTPSVIKDDYRKIIGTILTHLTLLPSYKLFEEITDSKKLYLEKDNTELFKYIVSICEFIYYSMARDDFYKVNHPNYGKDKELLKIFKERFPFTLNSRFFRILTDVISKDFNIKELNEDEVYEYSSDLKKKLIQYLLNVDRYFKEYYGFSIDVDKEDEIFEQLKKTIHLNEPFETFINKIPEVHRTMILLRSKFKLMSYYYRDDVSSKLKDKLNAMDSYQLTPLAYAILYRNKAAVEYLTTTSASLSNQTYIGKKKIIYSGKFKYNNLPFTILELARMVGDSEILNLLETKDKIQKRWNTNTIVGYHQTSSDVADIIEETHSNEYWFLAGSRGMCGPGIYFAETQAETDFKARIKGGIILRALIKMGNSYPIRSFEEREAFQKIYQQLDVDIIHHKLQTIGYDSVMVYRDNRPKKELPKYEGKPIRFMESGNEMIVYNTEQVHYKGISAVREYSGESVGGRSFEIHLQTDWILPIQTHRYKHLTKEQLNQRWLLNITPLMFACQNSNMKLIHWLVQEMNVDIHEKDSMNRNALFYAMRGGHKRVIKFLLNQNISLLEPDIDGKYVVEYFSDETSDLSYRTLVVDKLYTMGLVAHPLIVRYYQKTGRLMGNSVEQKRYEDYVHLMYKDVEKPVLTHMEIPKKYTVATAAGGRQ